MKKYYLMVLFVLSVAYSVMAVEQVNLHSYYGLKDGSQGNGWCFTDNTLFVSGDLEIIGKLSYNTRYRKVVVVSNSVCDLTTKDLSVDAPYPLQIKGGAKVGLNIVGGCSYSLHIEGGAMVSINGEGESLPIVSKVSGDGDVEISEEVVKINDLALNGKLTLNGGRIVVGTGSNSGVNVVNGGQLDIETSYTTGRFVCNDGSVNASGSVTIQDLFVNREAQVVVTNSDLTVDGIYVKGGTVKVYNGDLSVSRIMQLNDGNVHIERNVASSYAGPGRLLLSGGLEMTEGVLNVGCGIKAVNNGYVHVFGGVLTSKGSGYQSAIDLINGGQVVISGGHITVEGGYLPPATLYGQYSYTSAIRNKSGSIVITGGSVTAKSGIHGNVSIFGGNVEAVGCKDMPAIGGTSNLVYIVGGEIKAKGGSSAAAIGGEIARLLYTNEGRTSVGGSGDVFIEGGRVVAIGGSRGSGIGSGCYATEPSYVRITGGTVFAQGGELGAGIGGGEFGNGANVFISGGSVKAIGDKTQQYAEDIGHGGATSSSDTATFATLSSGQLVNEFGEEVSLVKWAYTNEVALAFDDYLYRYSGEGHEGDENLYFYLPKVDDAGATEVNLIEAGRIYKVNVVDGVVGVESLNGKADVTGDVVKMNGIRVGEGADDASRSVRLSVKVGMSSLVDEVVVVYGETLNELMKFPRVIEADCSVEGDVVMFEVDVPKGAGTGFFTVRVR